MKTFIRIWKLGPSADQGVLERDVDDCPKDQSFSELYSQVKTEIREKGDPGHYRINLEIGQNKGHPHVTAISEFMVLKEENEFLLNYFSEKELINLHKLDVLDSIIISLQDLKDGG